MDTEDQRNNDGCGHYWIDHGRCVRCGVRVKVVDAQKYRLEVLVGDRRLSVLATVTNQFIVSVGLEEAENYIRQRLGSDIINVLHDSVGDLGKGLLYTATEDMSIGIYSTIMKGYVVIFRTTMYTDEIKKVEVE